MKYIISLFASIFLQASASAQTPEQLKSWLPKVEGWTISEKVEVFTPDNLFNRINGSAPLFIENNFKEMTALEYTKGDDYITIQVYRHGSPEDTFGMYASERSPEMSNLPIGAEAQGDDTNIYFFADNVYVKIWANGSDNQGEVIRKIAKEFADNINPKADYPQIIKLFPQNGKLPYSETYITSNYIGHTFLNKVYTTNYEINNQTFQAFIIDNETEDKAKETLDNYFNFTKQPLDFQQGKLIITDRYNGNIPVIWKDKYIVGVFSESGNEIKNSEEFISQLAEKL